MILVNNSVLGTMFPIQISTIVKKSNAVWGVSNTDPVETQLAFTLFCYLGAMHVDLHAPSELNELTVQLLHKYGLPQFQKATSSLYDACVRRGSFSIDPYTDLTLLGDIGQALPGDPQWIQYSTVFLRWQCQAQMKAYVLRTLKRFTVDRALCLETECLRKFVATDARNKQVDRWCDTHYTSLIKYFARKYLKWALQDFKLENVYAELENWSFSTTSNAVHDCCADPRHRVGYVLSAISDLPGSYHRALVDSVGNEDYSYPYAKGRIVRDDSVVDVGCVPKDVKSYRIVSPDSPSNLAFQKAVFNELMRCLEVCGLSQYIPIKDQEIMRGLVYKTVAGEENYATLDLSSASDTLRLSLFREIFPEDVVYIVERVRPIWYRVPKLDNKKLRKLYMLAPMGCAFTTILQSLTFWSIDCAACHIQWLYCSESEDAKSTSEDDELLSPKCYAMGDDQQVPQKYAEGCIDALQRLGFIVNESKSFFDANSLFRESCGAEAITGVDPVVDGFYFPRHALSIKCMNKTDEVTKLTDLTISSYTFWIARDRSGEAYSENTLTAIIALSKTYYLLGLTKIAVLITQWLATVCPRMTISEFGVPADDLWGASEIVHQYKRLPLAHFVDVVKTEKQPPFFVKEHEVVSRKLISDRDDAVEHFRPIHWAISSKREKLGGVYNPDNGVHSKDHCAICRWLAKSGYNQTLFADWLCYYTYNKWLQTGPNFESPIDELLGVSSPTPQLDVISSCIESTRF